MSANTDLAREVVLALLRAGVRECCIAAGARNLPLLAVLAQAEAQGKMRLWHFFEERCAGFFALGRAMATRKPVAVVTTSGTAAAELLPAIIEARYQGLPLIAVTADRPSSWRGSGAPQAIDQIGIYAEYAGETIDLHAGETCPDRWWTVLQSGNQPRHVNVCFEEPEAKDAGQVELEDQPDGAKPGMMESREIAAAVHSHFFEGKCSSLVLVGGLHPTEADAVGKFLQRLGWPILAEATANLHHRPALYPLFILGGECSLQTNYPNRVLRIGSVPHWRWWRDLEDDTDMGVLSFTKAPYPGLARLSHFVVTDFSALEHLAVTKVKQERSNFSSWHSAGLHALMTAHPASEVALLHAVRHHLGEKAVIYLGNSMPIREWHCFYSLLEPKGRHYYASRGANGIDGQLSTFFGVAEGAEEAWGIFGDLTTLYDLAGPWILRQTLPKKLRLVVINNLGGDIFTRLPSVKGADERTRQLVRNPHQLEFGAWAQMWGMDYLRVTAPQELEEGLSRLGPVAVIELAPDAEQSAAFWQHYAELGQPKKEGA